jgi:predicted regulator of amino acid metabolism with ACT domain
MVSGLWSKVKHYFDRLPGQGRVAQVMLEYGLRVDAGRIYCGRVRISETALGRAAGVDRRVVSATVRTIEDNEELAQIFSRLWPVCHLRDVAPLMRWGAIEIVPTDARKPGILAGVSSIISRASISIRQVIVDDPEVVDQPRGFIITESPVPSELLPEIKDVEGVQGVVIY